MIDRQIRSWVARFIPGTPTTPFPYNAGWLDFSSPSFKGGYWRDGAGIVHLEGLITTNSGAPNTYMFTLPVGFRSRMTHDVPAAFFVNPNWGMGVITISPDGTVSNPSMQIGTLAWSPNATPDTSFVNVSGLSFRAA